MPIKIPWTQEEFMANFKELFPEEWVRGMQLPMIKDVINKAPFTTFRDFLADKDRRVDGPLGPTIVTNMRRGWRRAAEQQQQGAMFSKECVEQLIPPGLSSDEHFQEAIKFVRGSEKSPFQEDSTCDRDLRMAAWWIAQDVSSLGERRRENYQSVVTLSTRLEPVSQHLRQSQTTQVSSVAGGVHIALIAAACVLSSWPDWQLPMRYITGFRSTGKLDGQAS